MFEQHFADVGVKFMKQNLKFASKVTIGKNASVSRFEYEKLTKDEKSS